MSWDPDNRTPLTEPGRFYAGYTEKLDVVIVCDPDDDHTDQSFADESDINSIMARYQSTGEMPILNEREGQWLDTTGMDFQRHMDYIISAQELFQELPSAIRDRFNNDPATFLDFTGNDANKREMAQMGLLSPEATEAILYPPPDFVPAPAPTPPKEGS